MDRRGQLHSGARGSDPHREIRSVEETPLDFRTAKELGKDIADPYEQMKIGSGYDHNFVLNHYDGKTSQGGRG